jgi:hypothetical protein
MSSALLYTVQSYEIWWLETTTNNNPLRSLSFNAKQPRLEISLGSFERERE